MFDKLINRVDPPLDFVGQELSRKLLHSIYLIGFAIAILCGYILADLKYTLFVGIFTSVLAFVIVVPAWPIYRRNPVKFVEVVKKKEE